MQKMVEGLGLRFEFIGMIRRRKGRLPLRFPPGATLAQPPEKGHPHTFGPRLD